jgi:LuxR family transcriptional regulator, maltose regulon positive regulatory protein
LTDALRPLLATKLYVPKPRRGLVARPRLSERLSRGFDSKLTLVSAPAGFGKSTLLAEWLASAGAGAHSVAWLSLDQADNQPVTFWTYVVSALRKVVPGVGASALSMLEAPQPPPIETVLATLLNELGALPNDIVLVLDDYHVIDALGVDDEMAFLLDHLPPRMHVVIATRSDPGLPLARLRGRGELVEIRAADLRFTPDEAAAYLNEVMGLELATGDISALEARTEGWIAALQLAALSMQGRDDIAGFIASFAGDDRYIVDYLVEEVLRRQPEHVRTFLLQTSILGRMSGPLCDVVTGQEGGKAMLEALDRGNLFVVPLDDRRRWYRYHHLFADVLRAHLLDEQPERVPELHRRAGEWYERNGERSEAIRHALAADDLDRAADLVELALPAMRKGRQEAAVLAWLRALPDELVGRRPVLGAAFAWVLISIGELDDVERHLQEAERWLTEKDGVPDGSGVGPPGMAVANRDEFRLLPGMLALYRAVLAQIRGDVPATVRYAQAVLDLAPEDDDLLHGGAAAILGLAAWASGDLEAAHLIHAEGMARVQRAGNISDAMNASIALADIRITQGRLGEAIQTYDQALQLSMKHGEPVLPGTADLYVGLGDIVREQGDLTSATQHLQKSKDLGAHLGFPQSRHRLHVVTARIREAEGDLDGALDALNEAQRVYVPDFSPDVHPLPARKARVWVRQGRSAEAGAWARERSLSADDDLSYLREFEHITLARLLLAGASTSQTDRADRNLVKLLERLLDAAEAGGRTGSVIEILILQTLALQVGGDLRAALVPLERALTLAEPEGYVRMFVDEGRSMEVLLEAAAKQGIAPTYVRRLLAGFGKGEKGAVVKQALIEPLSERELEVLRLLASDLGGPDIARELVVSLNTVRTHTKNIYSKLGVNDRRAAVSRAAELGLLSRSRRD